MADLPDNTDIDTGIDAEADAEGVDVRDERPGTTPPGLTSFRIATYNVHSCVGIDAKFAPGRIATVVKALEADVVGLQEVGWHHRGEIGLDQFEFLSRETGMKAWPGPTKHHERAHYGNALLSRLPVLDVRPMDLSLPHREPRGAIDADIQVGDKVVRVIVAHLGLDPWERNAQITRVLHTVERGPAAADRLHGRPERVAAPLAPDQAADALLRRLRRPPQLPCPDADPAAGPHLRVRGAGAVEL